MKVYAGRCCAKGHTGCILIRVLRCQASCSQLIMPSLCCLCSDHGVAFGATFEAAVSNISFVDKAAATMSLT